jgi:4-hydroxybenzoate polyprenyltransferase
LFSTAAIEASADPSPVADRLKTHPGPLRALAATARLANLPSVVSNVLTGVLPFAGAAFGAGVSFALVAAVCLYLSGGFINDWADRRWDAARRPERALPRGLFTPGFYLLAGLALASCGVAAAALHGSRAPVVAAAIALNIGLYTWLHKKSAWSAVFMGLCRALLPLLGWSAAGADAAMMPAAMLAGLALFFHVAGISLLARSESLAQPARGASRACLCFAGSALVMGFAARWIFEIPLASAGIGLLPYALWTGRCLLRRMQTADRISGLLAGIPLVDWMLLLPIGIALDGWQAGFCLWLPLSAFVAGRALQRFAPAT